MCFVEIHTRVHEPWYFEIWTVLIISRIELNLNMSNLTCSWPCNICRSRCFFYMEHYIGYNDMRYAFEVTLEIAVIYYSLVIPSWSFVNTALYPLWAKSLLGLTSTLTQQDRHCGLDSLLKSTDRQSAAASLMITMISMYSELSSRIVFWILFKTKPVKVH